MSKIFTNLDQFAQSMGFDESVSKAVVFLFLMLTVGILLKFIIPKRKFKSKDIQKTKTQLGLTPVPGIKTNFPSASEGRIGMRHFDRIETKVKATYSTEINPNLRDCKIIDISLSGLAFVCDEVIQHATRVRFNLPNLNKGYNIKEFMVGGEVVRAKPNGKYFEYGIKYFHIFKRDEELLQLLMDKYK